MFSKTIMNSLFLFIIPCILLSGLPSCASGDPSGAEQVFHAPVNISVETADVYSVYLVDPESYSTNGAYYQKTYEKEIITVVKTLKERYMLNITERSAGFYFDRKSRRRDRLYFGFDIMVTRGSHKDEAAFAAEVIKKNVEVILNEILKFGKIMDENEISGVVIGFKWKEGISYEQINIWMKKEDIFLAREGKITVTEMYQRSTISNTEGKVILLPI